MARAIFKVFFSIITSLVSIVLAPINILASSVLPDLTLIINKFNYALNTYFGRGLTWFFSILPSGVRSVVIIYLVILVSYYTITISIHGILKVYHIIQRIKFW